MSANALDSILSLLTAFRLLPTFYFPIMPKKVLIITYYWPPAGGIAVVRWVKFAKYLREYGWEPLVYTVSNGSYPILDESLLKDVPDNITILKQPIWEPHHLYRFFSLKKNTSGLADIKPKNRATFFEKMANWARSNFFIPDARAFWIKPSVRYLSSYLKLNPVDAIVSTGPPHSAHLIALALKKKLGLPWLADFRDPWTTMDYYKELLLTKWADKKHHRLEVEVLKGADSITVVGRGMKKEFEEKSGREVNVVTNGYDEDDFLNDAPTLDLDFSIIHVGTFFARINPINLWQTLAELKDEGHPMFLKLKIKLMGRVDPMVVDAIRSFGLEKFLELIPYQQHDQAIRNIRSAQVLLMCVFEPTKFVLTGKLFEYLATHRPILMVGPVDGDAAQVIKETRAGECFSFSDKIEIRAYLLDLYRKFGSGDLNSIKNDSRKHTHRLLAKQMTDQLNTIIPGS